MNILAITQARTGSTRLPGKVLKTVRGQRLLAIHLQRLKRARLVEQIVVATTNKPDDEPIVEIARALGVPAFRGSETDVLDRYYRAAVGYRPQYVVRVTSDCPLIDPTVVDAVIATCCREEVDYCSNTLDRTYPVGNDVECFRFEALQAAWKQADQPSQREHVTPFIYHRSDWHGHSQFAAANRRHDDSYLPCDCSSLRMTVDYAEDLEVIRRLVHRLGTERPWQDYARQLLADEACGESGHDHHRSGTA